MNYGRGPVQSQMMVPFTKVVKRLVIANVVIWVLFQVIIEQYFMKTPWFTEILGLSPGRVYESFFIWQPLTYMFLHDLSPFHILFNMLSLWWLGAELESHWGSRFFAIYYFVCGIGAGIIYVLVSLLYYFASGNTHILFLPVIGASGAVFGLMLAYGLIFGERMVYFMFAFPMKARYFVMILAGVEVVMLLNQGIGGGQVANLAHLGGLISGFLFLIFWRNWGQRPRRKPSSSDGRKLRLVVDNEDSKTPKYWN